MPRQTILRARFLHQGSRHQIANNNRLEERCVPALLRRTSEKGPSKIHPIGQSSFDNFNYLQAKMRPHTLSHNSTMATDHDGTGR